MIWAVRIAGKPQIVVIGNKFLDYFQSGFLLFRVLKMGSDTRFDDIRSHFFKFLGAS